MRFKVLCLTLALHSSLAFGLEDDDVGLTPLMIAAKYGKLAAVQFLYYSGADVDQKNRLDRTPLHLAALNGHLEIVKFLVKDCEADVNKTNKWDKTPLHYAAEEGRIDVVQFLVQDCGVDVNQKNRYEETPLHLATQRRHKEIVEFLEKKMAGTSGDPQPSLLLLFQRMTD